MELDKKKLKFFLKDKSILELGCNRGLITRQILKYNPRKIYCIDFDDKFKSDFLNIDNKIKFKKINFLKKKELMKLPKKVDIIFLRDIFNCFDYKTNKTILSNLTNIYGEDIKILLICFYDRVIIKSFLLSIIKFNFTNGLKNYLKLKKNNPFIKNKRKYLKYFSSDKKIYFYSKDLFQDHLSISQKISNYFFKYSIFVE